MKTLKSLLSAFSMVLSMSALLGFSAYSAAKPNVGDPAPDFKLMGSDGNTYTVSQFKGVKPVVIAFFPKAFTGG
jgi:peroxiredoxin Q/BCP